MFAIIKSKHIFVFWPTKNSHTQNGNMPKKITNKFKHILKKIKMKSIYINIHTKHATKSS